MEAAWSLMGAFSVDPFPKSPDWYDLTLLEVREIRVRTNPQFWDEKKRGPMPETVPMLSFEFETEIDGLRYQASKLVNPTMGPKGNLYKLATSLHNVSEPPKSALRNALAFQEWCEQLIGRTWQLQVARNEKDTRNVIIGIGKESVGKTLTKQEAARVVPDDNDLGFGPTDVDFCYDIANMPHDKQSRAIELLKAAGGVQDGLGIWRCTSRVEKLVKYEVKDVTPF